MDERSIRDDTVLLVSAGDEENWPLKSVRASFAVSAEKLVCYFSGHMGIEEDAEDAAETADGVLSQSMERSSYKPVRVEKHLRQRWGSS